MALTLEELKPTILALPESERWQLYDWLADVMPCEINGKVEGTSEFDAELDRRYAEFLSNPSKAIDGAEFMARMRQRAK